MLPYEPPTPYPEDSLLDTGPMDRAVLLSSLDLSQRELQIVELILEDSISFGSLMMSQETKINYVQVAKKAGLDRRTVKKIIDGIKNKGSQVLA